MITGAAEPIATAGDAKTIDSSAEATAAAGLIDDDDDDFLSIDVG